ncbi:MAG: hypothetical protein RDU30_16420 [Desulfovibrionaceae bacterium]|nr:hypothetical protein [Desulfovibrionaceae bacterium]
MLVFDTPQYMNTLDWFGQPTDTSCGPVVLRRVGRTYWDAWGSWPYQSLPTLERLQAIRDLPKFSPLAFTAVIRPDVEAVRADDKVSSIRKRYNVEFRVLKTHLGHCPGHPPGRGHYSRRTRRRLEHATRVFFVQRETLLPEHLIMSHWQSRLKKLRSINAFSSPDEQHFARLITSFGSHPEDTACIALRRRDTGTLAGIFLFFSALGSQGWHAHSFLLEEGVLKDFGAYVLFDQAIALLGDTEVWFGGAPSGANGKGVFTFKQKFANCSGQAHILSVDLNDIRLKEVRSSCGTSRWLPDYRNQR